MIKNKLKMEGTKRKFLDEPVPQVGTSRYGRKTSQFVFKVVDAKTLKVRDGSKDSLIKRKKIQKEIEIKKEIIDDIEDIQIHEINNDGQHHEMNDNEIQNFTTNENDNELQNFTSNEINDGSNFIKHEINDIHNIDTCLVEKEEIVQTVNEIEENTNEIIDGPSIILCGMDDLGDSLYEQHFDIMPNKVIKKVTINKPQKKSISRPPKINRKPKILSSLTPSGKQRLGEKLNKLSASQPLDLPSMLTDSQPKLKFERPLNESESKQVEEKILSEEKRLKDEQKRLTSLLKDLKLKEEVISVMELYENDRLTLSKLTNNQEMFYFYLGFKDGSFLNPISAMGEKIDEFFAEKEFEKISNLQSEEMIVLTLMKLRRNYPMIDLSFRFKITIEEAEKVVLETVKALYEIFYTKELPTESLLPPSNLPPQFGCFPNCKLILDILNINLEDENSKDINLYSKIKEKRLYKSLIAICPTKKVLLTTHLYDLTVSNTTLANDSGILNRLKSGDLIMADKSFDLTDCVPSGVDINFNLNIDTSSELHKRHKTLNSKARSYIGRTTMQNIRRFAIFSQVPKFLLPIVDELVGACAAIVNMQLVQSTIIDGE